MPSVDAAQPVVQPRPFFVPWNPTAAVTPGIHAAIHIAVARFREILVRFAATQGPATPASLLDFELDLHAQVARECLDPFVGTEIQAAHDFPEVQGRVQALRIGIPHLKSQRASETVTLRLRGGSEFTVTTPYGLVRPPRGPGHPRSPGSREEEGNGIYPFLAVLGIQFRMTPALASEVARLVATGTYEDCQQSLALRGVKLSLKEIERVGRRMGDLGLSYRDWMVQQTEAGYRGLGLLRGKRIAIGVDGGRLRTRIEKTGRKKKSGRHGFKAEWREPKVIVIYEIDRKGRRKPGSLLRYEATMGDADQTFRLLVALLREIGAHEAEEWVVTADGALWISDRTPKLIEALGYDPRRVTEVLDRYHATEYLTAIAEGRKDWSDPQRKRWIQRMKGHLHRGEVEKILAERRKICQGRNAREQGKHFRYLAQRKEKMRYAEYRRRGIPSGSGAVESCVRRVVNLRLKGAGIFWRPEQAERVLHLRAHLRSGRWNEHVRVILEHPALRTRAGLAHAA